jgi:type I restriction enzyme M protein
MAEIPLGNEQNRSSLIEQFRTRLGYSSSWLAQHMTLIDEAKFFGFSFSNDLGSPYLFAAICSPGELDAAEGSLKGRSSMNPYFGIGLAYDGSNTRYLRRRFDSDKFEYIKDLEHFQLGPTSLLNALSNLRSGDLGEGRSLTPLKEGLENVFFEVHSHLRDIDGLHADAALDELCKLIYVKLYDEETTAYREQYRLQRWGYSSTDEFASVARHLYTAAGEYDTRVFSLKIPGYQRSRGVFSGSIKLSSPALVKALESLQDFSLTEATADVKGRAFQKVLIPAVRSGMGQYFTPEPIIQFMVSIAKPKISDLILDPFCGSGHFLTSCLQSVRSQTKDDTGKAFHEFAFGKLHGIEKSDRMVRVAMTDMRLHGDGHSNVRCTDSLLAFQNYPDIHPDSFDLVLTNPPFGSLLGAEAQAQLGHFELSASRKATPLEVLGVERSLQFLRPGGRLLIVLPDGIVGNSRSQYVRDWIQHQGKIRAIISLPVETFSPFGANIKTSILVLRKWKHGERSVADYKVFMARVDSIGYDATGRPNGNSELEDVRKDLAKFLEEEGW